MMSIFFLKDYTLRHVLDNTVDINFLVLKLLYLFTDDLKWVHIFGLFLQLQFQEYMKKMKCKKKLNSFPGIVFPSSV